jgi:type 1 glutamine amidotransferase
VIGSSGWHRDARRALLFAILFGALALAAALAASAAAPTAAHAQVEQGRYSVLVFSRTTGFRHTAAIAAGHTALEAMGDAEDFDTTHSEDATDFTSHNLRNYDVVVFLNTDGEGILNAAQRTAFERWMQRGGGAVSIHADANADKAWDWKRDMFGGGLFDNHPPIQEATVEVADPDHPATDDLPASFSWTDEFYNFEADPREQVHVLLTVDPETYEGSEHGEGHLRGARHLHGHGDGDRSGRRDGHSHRPGDGHGRAGAEPPAAGRLCAAARGRGHVGGGAQAVVGARVPDAGPACDHQLRGDGDRTRHAEGLEADRESPAAGRADGGVPRGQVRPGPRRLAAPEAQAIGGQAADGHEEVEADAPVVGRGGRHRAAAAHDRVEPLT